MKLDYRHTRAACYLGYVIQAIVNLFPPLLFVRFREEFGVSLAQLTLVVMVNFSTQITTDLVATPFILRYGYRVSMVAAQGCAAFGLLGLALLPDLLPNPYLGILIPMAVSAIGGGLMEVLVSPVVQSLPSKNKVAEMNFLHSAYCWGAMFIILASTALFATVGISHWRAISASWAIVPVLNALLLLRVPIATPEDDGAKGLGLAGLLRSGVFWLLVLLMVCSGASELAMSQWASLFAEKGLLVNKTMGDLLGPCAFAFFMATARLWYGFKSERLDLRRSLVATSVLCIASYVLAVFSPHPVLSLVGCGLCGLSVGFMWPGTFSLATQALPRGGTLMFALLAFAGDIGCAVGPGTVGLVSNHLKTLGRGFFAFFGSDPEIAALKSGMLCAAVFPLLLAMFARAVRKSQEENA